MKVEKESFPKVKKIQGIFKSAVKPLFGKNRSFSCTATLRKWKRNKQKIKLGDKSYIITPRFFKIISKQLKI